MESVQSVQFNYFPFILSSVLSFLSVHSSLVEKPIFQWFNKQSSTERKLLLERSSLKREQLGINMVDEFAKYSKIQRKINSIQQQLEEIKGTKPTNSLIVQLMFTYGVKLALVLLLIILSIYYRYTPVICLGNYLNLVPFTYFICYPNDVNCISFYFWSMCTASIARVL